MSTGTMSRVLPMRAADTHHFIERTYREGGKYQWVRETMQNAIEAGATRIEYGVEWQAVENQKVYRRVIADNGCGMSGEQLVGFFNTFGGGGKPIGGIHENFGVGAKTSLLPWNRYGVVVISWVDGDAAMIWLTRDDDTGEYGLKLEETADPATGEESLDEVYAPYDDEEHGCDWSTIKPDWIKDHGTVIVLLGNSPTENTVEGDPTHAESDIKGISTYLNRRYWDIPNDARVTVDEFRTNDRLQWARSASEAHGAQPKRGVDLRTNTRTIEGAKHFIEYPSKSFRGGKLAASGTVSLSDGTHVDWFLWDGKRPAVQSYAAIGGYIGALYKNELYDVTSHHSTYRSFGLTDSKVRRNVWLVIRPPEDKDGEPEVYPKTDRNSLLMRGGLHAGNPLPYYDWAGEFADSMPAEILAAIKAARGGETASIEDQVWRERLADRFGSRWRIAKLRARKGGSHTVDPAQEGGTPKRRKVIRLSKLFKGGGSGGRGGADNTGTGGGSKPAVKRKVAGGIPHFRPVSEDEMEPGYLAVWQPNDPEYAEGVVLLNRDHKVLRSIIEHWQSQYADHHAEDIEHEVIKIYGEIAVAKVAHSEHIKGLLPSKVVEDDLRSNAALTMALLGLVGEEAVIAPRLGGKFRKTRNPSAAR